MTAAAPPSAGWRPESRTAWVWAIVLALVAVRLVAAAVIELGSDESYYFLWSRYPSLGYYDHPPMVAWWIAASTALFGDSPFAIRVLFVLSAIPTTAATWFAARRLFDAETAGLAALWLNATLLIGVGGTSATPDAPAVLFWTLAIAAFVLVVATGRGAWWLVVGLCAGLGVLSKLTGLFLGLGLLVALAATPDLRRWFASLWLWVGGAIAIVVVAPLLWWNAGHGWMTFASQFSRLGAAGFNPLHLPEFIATQFALLNPLIALFVVLAVVAWVRRLAGYPVRGIALLAWTTAPLVAYMLWHALRVQVQAHWLAPIYPTLAIVAAAAATAPHARQWIRLRASALPVGIVLSLIGLVLAANPGGILPPQVDPGRANHGWAAVAQDTARLARDAGAQWIAPTQYAAGAMIAYHLAEPRMPVVPVTDRHRYVFAPAPDAALLSEPALVVVRERDADRLAGCFADLKPAGTIERRSGGAVIETLVAFRAASPKPDLFATGCW